MAADAAPGATAKSRHGGRLWLGILVISLICLTAIVIFSYRGFYQVYQLKQERLRLEQENARLAEENARLARTIDRLHHDPDMIQDIIRRELNFLKSNEVIVQLTPSQEGKTHPAAGAVAPPLAKPAPAGGRTPKKKHPQVPKGTAAE